MWKGFCPQWISRHKPILPVSYSPSRRIVDGVSKASRHRFLQPHRHDSRWSCFRIRRKPTAECGDRTGERIAGISCPRCGQQVPKGLGHFQIGRLQGPSGPYNQPVTVKNDSPGRAARYLLQQQDDTCWHFPDTFLTLFTYLRKRYQSVCQSVLSAKRRLADTLTLFFKKTFFRVLACSPFHSCSA